MQLEKLLSRVYDEVPSVPELLALRTLADSVREFCQLTHIWQDMAADVFVTVDTAQYNLVPPAGLRIIAPVEVRIDGVLLVATPVDLMRRVRTVPLAGIPRTYTQWTPTLIELDRPALVDAVLTVKAALTLELDEVDADVPDDIINGYGEAIAAGAKMRLVRQAGQPWTDPASSGSHAATYYAAIHTAKRQMMTALDQAEVQVEMRQW